MLDFNSNEPNGKQTEFLLKAIAARLSGREDCRNVNYTVTIDHNGISMVPLVYVYKDKHNRKESDKLDIVSFVHKYKMQGALLSGFVFGTYEYQSSTESKRRKWRRAT